MVNRERREELTRVMEDAIAQVRDAHQQLWENPTPDMVEHGRQVLEQTRTTGWDCARRVARGLFWLFPGPGYVTQERLYRLRMWDWLNQLCDDLRRARTALERDLEALCLAQTQTRRLTPLEDRIFRTLGGQPPDEPAVDICELADEMFDPGRGNGNRVAFRRATFEAVDGLRSLRLARYPQVRFREIRFIADRDRVELTLGGRWLYERSPVKTTSAGT